MIQGLLFAVFTGLMWTAAGIVISRCAKDDFDLCAYSLLHNLLSGVAAMALFTKTDMLSFGKEQFLMYGIILFAGIFNAVAQYFVRIAMKSRNHALVWAMMQTCMLFPFLFGIIVFHERAGILRCIGIVFLIAGIFLPCIKGFRSIRNCLLPTMTALFLYGASQILYLICSHYKVLTDPASMRPALAGFGNMTGWVLLIGIERQKKVFSRKVVSVAVGMTLVNIIGLYLFFRALDILSGLQCGSIAIPVTMGFNILWFSLYSVLILKEKNSPVDFASMGMILAGLAFSAAG